MNKHPSNVSETASNKPASNATAFVLPGTAVAPYRAFTAALSNGDTCPVHASNGTDWQDFIGTYNAGTLAQTTLLESSTGTWVDWSAGADVLLEIAWLGAAGEDTDAHLASTSNPHSVTAAQVGAYTSGAVDTLLTGKSDTGHTHTGVYEPASAGIQSHISDTALHSVGAQITAATSKATPVDADELGLVDSAASNVLKKLTWANLKATLTSIFALLAGKAGGQTLIGGTGVTDALILQGTSGNGTAASPAVRLKVGNNGGTTALTVLNNGNVGIGTTTPGQKFEVSGGRSRFSLDNSGIIQSYRPGNLLNAGNIHFQGDNSVSAITDYSYISSAITSNVSGLESGELSFYTKNGGVISEKLRMASNGNVGIGTTAPSAKLTVNTGNIHYNTTYTDASNYERLAITGTAGSNVQIKAETAGTGADNLSILLTPAGTGDVSIGTLTVKSTSNVGVGMTSPLHYLDITKSAENQRTVYGVNAVMTAATLQQDTTATGNDQTLTNQYYAWPFTASASHTVGSWAIRLKKVGTVTNTTNYIRLKIYSDNAGVPNTLLLTTDVVMMGSLTSSYVSYLFGGDLTLVSGTTYWIAVERSAAVTGGGSIAVDYNGTALTTATVAAPTSGDWTVSAGLGRYVVYGRSPLALYGNSTNSIGVYGSSTNNYGVNGISTNNYGVYGSSTNNYGVYGNSTNSIGVYGISTNSYGVRGISTNSVGVHGISTNSYGVWGSSTNSYGVHGISTNSVGVYGSSTNSYGGVFYQEGTLTSANSVNTVIIRRYGVTNSTGSLNYSGNVLQITDNPTGTGTVSGALISGSVDGTTRLNFDPRVVDGASAVAYMLDTKNTLANATAKLFALRNEGVEKFSVLANGSVDINSDTLRVRTSRTPASATATGNAGDVCWDTDYIYVCTATNTWKRSAISTW